MNALCLAEVAARFHREPGFVFFDTALAVPGAEAVSMIAARPRQTVRGASDADWHVFKETLAAQRGEGFAAGWVDYDGAFCFGFYDQVLRFDHRAGTWRGEPAGWIETTAAMEPVGRLPFAASMPCADYMQRVRRAQEFIAAGHIYQVNLAHRFAAPWPGRDPFALYSELRRCSPAPHAAYLAFPERTVLSSSPELFLKIDGRRIVTRPIKGTRPRFADPLADARSAAELIGSPKERAELIMITDLERNDLGQVCEFGSVRASEVLKLERYEQVYHLVSTVEGELRPDVDAVTAVRACFPGGSITGAPKKRAMEIIRELEPGPRGLFTGAIGYFGFDGSCQFSIAIRTLVIEQGEAHFHVGAGIVADSDPLAEWEETLHKAAGIRRAAHSI
ncbi:MAG: aminodeoxychorismate synthase component I [Chthoniobacteraceae bacterium]